MLGLIIGAAVLGTIIAVMEDGEFPGWGPMIVCVLAALLPPMAITPLLPPDLFYVGIIIGAIAAAIAISATLGMSATRSAIAAGTWLVIHIVLAMTLGKLMRL